ncbi:hypothetical protein LC653_32225 [Nostoc sp. CHAB 5784]|nr:hypothetical protein [Nostoc mirabile CHAB5784]
MVISVAHLGPPGTYSEAATIAYVKELEAQTGQQVLLRPYSNIAQTIQALANGLVDFAVVPVENSVEGGVSMTLDTNGTKKSRNACGLSSLLSYFVIRAGV